MPPLPRVSGGTIPEACPYSLSVLLRTWLNLMTITKTIVSAGGVVVSGTDNPHVLLVATHGRTRWCLPKGIVEPGESAEAAAHREVLEETGVESQLICHLERVEYWYTAQPGIRHHKFVDFFLFRSPGGQPRPQTSEVDDAAWFPIADAVRQASYRSEQDILLRLEDRWATPPDHIITPTSTRVSSA